tara:strand:+ start:885 stop:1361 length:477 start_codon:yes stop_codon:yes gene_type:complete
MESNKKLYFIVADKESRISCTLYHSHRPPYKLLESHPRDDKEVIYFKDKEEWELYAKNVCRPAFIELCSVSIPKLKNEIKECKNVCCLLALEEKLEDDINCLKKLKSDDWFSYNGFLPYSFNTIPYPHLYRLRYDGDTRITTIKYHWEDGYEELFNRD